MAKKNKKAQRRNAGPPRTPRATTPVANAETPLSRLGYTAAGAAATSLVGAFLAREGWAPKTVATALSAVGAGLAWKGDESTIRSVGAGAMSAAGSQLALMMMEDSAKKPAASTAAKSPTATASASPARQANDLPPGSLENAFERAKARLVLSASESADYAA